MKIKLTFIPILIGTVLLFGCGQKGAEPEQAPTTQETASESETTEQVLYHGGEPRTPEETLAQALTDVETPVCPECGEKMRAVLVASEELPVKERACISMAQGSDAVYDLSITYDWKCEPCGYCDSGHTVEGNRVTICHGWTS